MGTLIVTELLPLLGLRADTLISCFVIWGLAVGDTYSTLIL